MIAGQPSVFWGIAIRRGVLFWVGVRAVFAMVAGVKPSIAGSLLTLGVVAVLSGAQIVAMRERSFYGNAGLNHLPLVVPVLAAVPLEIVLAIVAGAG